MVSFRDMNAYKELDLGWFFADRAAFDAWNSQLPEGLRIRESEMPQPFLAEGIAEAFGAAEHNVVEE